MDLVGRGEDWRDNRIAELERELAAKYARIAELEGRVAALEKQVAELHEKLGRNSHNSHLPPSTDPPGTRAGNGKGSRRKRGGHPGHGGTTPMLLPPEEVDEVVNLYPLECENCWKALPEVPDPSAGAGVEHPCRQDRARVAGGGAHRHLLAPPILTVRDCNRLPVCGMPWIVHHGDFADMGRMNWASSSGESDRTARRALRGNLFAERVMTDDRSLTRRESRSVTSSSSSLRAAALGRAGCGRHHFSSHTPARLERRTQLDSPSPSIRK